MCTLTANTSGNKNVSVPATPTVMLSAQPIKHQSGLYTLMSNLATVFLTTAAATGAVNRFGQNKIHV